MKKKLRGFIVLLVLVLISASLTSGLELSASTGGNQGSSSTHVAYGATVEDYANEHIQLAPGDGSLSNDFSGTGNLPSASSVVQDNRLPSKVAQDSYGNTATVSRSVVGKPGYTTWSYNWGTSTSNGAYAWINNMNVKNAYSITGGATASNREGDSAVVQTLVSSQSPTASISNYQNAATATTTQATASQSANSASGSITTTSHTEYKPSFAVVNAVDSSLNIQNGLIGGYQNSASASANFQQTATTSQNIQSASGSSINVQSNALNLEGDKSKVSVGVTKGSLKNWYDKSYADTYSAQSTENVNAAGSSVSVESHAENKRHAYEGTNLNVNFGGADFKIVRNNALTANVKSYGYSNLVGIDVTGLPAGTNTAIMLEPFASFTVNQGATDMKTTVFSTLVNKGYATTRYTDSAASKDKFISGLDKYNVVLVLGHMDASNIYLSTSDQMSDKVSASDLKYNNPPSQSLVILAGCDSFKPVSSKDSISSRVQNAKLSAAFTNTVNAAWAPDYMGKLFQNMGGGMTFKNAESDAWNKYLPNVWWPKHMILFNKPVPMNPLTMGQYNIRELSWYGNTGFKL